MGEVPLYILESRVLEVKQVSLAGRRVQGYLAHKK